MQSTNTTLTDKLLLARVFEIEERAISSSKLMSKLVATQNENRRLATRMNACFKTT